jgi:mRNA interferase RelE/StbE
MPHTGWAIHLPHRVERQLTDVPSPLLQQDIRDALEHLRHEPRPSGCKKLKGRLDCWRVRVGAYRILYDIDDRHRTLVILKIGPRKDVYRIH